MRRNIDDLTLFQDQNLTVTVGQRGQPVCDTITILHAPRAIRHEIRIHDRLAIGVQSASRLVENKNSRVVDQRSRDGKALSLSAREIGRPFLDICVVTIRHALSMNSSVACEAGRPHRVLHREARPARDDIVSDRPTKEKIVLQDDAKVLAQMAKVNFAEVDTIYFE